jgi:uncharacterized protein (TIGR00255 family)
MSMIASMTGFAREAGEAAGIVYAWELRSVNGRGLEIRLRLPAGHDALEPGLRDIVTRAFKRGNVSASLTIRREAAATLALDEAALDQVLVRALELARRIPGAAPPRAEALLALPGVLRAAAAAPEEAETAALQQVLRQAFASGVTALAASRQQEGARLASIIGVLLSETEALCMAARAAALAQPAHHQSRLQTALAELLGAVPPVSEDRLAQEIALLATKSDVREELDRLAAHIAAARALVAEGGAIGRRFDFLTQEFNREANTLCSKAATLDLTAAGLKLKAVIEQLREQIQNIE